MTTPRADPRALVAVTVTAALTGAGAGFFWTRMSGTYYRICADAIEGYCMFSQWMVGVMVFFATVAGMSLSMLLVVSVLRLWPQLPTVLTAFLLPSGFLVVFNVAEPLGGYRIPLLAVFSALLQLAVAWTARTVRPALPRA